MKLISLRGKYGIGKFALVDDDDYEKVNKYKWHVLYGYARREQRENRKRFCLFMHTFVMQTPKGFIVDHINGNSLDNRKCNLRLTNRQGNARNARKRKDGLSSRFIGVYFDSERGKNPWVAKINIEGKRTYIGSFAEEKVAALARDAWAKKYYGEYAKLNNIEVTDRLIAQLPEVIKYLNL